VIDTLGDDVEEAEFEVLPEEIGAARRPGGRRQRNGRLGASPSSHCVIDSPPRSSLNVTA